MTAPTYDVVIIGAGIHGVGVAQAAAAAGYSVLVLECTQPAVATSCRSSKLIHGGLRYLETGQFGLVREALRERELLLRLAPRLVRRVTFHIPVYAHSARRAWKIRTGLSLYALLGGLGRNVRFATVPRSQWGRLDGLATEGLQAVYRYDDAQTDDAQLTHAVLRSAQSLGVELRCPANFSSAQRHPNGFAVHYLEHNTETTCHAHTLVNAAGPWVNTVLARITPQPTALPIELVQGAHIVLTGAFPRGAYYVEAPRDRRPVFMLPHGEATLVGTTETSFDGDPAVVEARPEEIAYLQETVSHYFPGRDTTARAHFAGVRVLPADTSAFVQRTRETTLLPDDARAPRLISIYGGKLTTYRAVATRVVQQLRRVLPPTKTRADTTTLPLTD